MHNEPKTEKFVSWVSFIAMSVIFICGIISVVLVYNSNMGS